MADAAAGIRHVTEIARDDMDVDMRDGLAGGGPGVEADVVAIGLRIEAEVEEALGVDELDILGVGRLMGADLARASVWKGVAKGTIRGTDSKHLIPGMLPHGSPPAMTPRKGRHSVGWHRSN